MEPEIVVDFVRWIFNQNPHGRIKLRKLKKTELALNSHNPILMERLDKRREGFSNVAVLKRYVINSADFNSSSLRKNILVTHTTFGLFNKSYIINLNLKNQLFFFRELKIKTRFITYFERKKLSLYSQIWQLHYLYYLDKNKKKLSLKFHG